MYPTSGLLKFSNIKGLHSVDVRWWISLGRRGCPFELAPQPNTQTRGCHMDMLGKLYAEPGYLWDGSSGPTWDGKPDPVPSLVHDILYEALRTGNLTKSRAWADKLYYELLRERGMGKVRSRLRWVGLRLFGWVAARRRKVEYEENEAA